MAEQTKSELAADVVAVGIRTGGEIAAKYLEECAGLWRGKHEASASDRAHAEWCETYAEGTRMLTQEP